MENDNLTPSIILTSDDSEWKPCEQDSVSSMESIPNSASPRASYNSLLHWGINSPVDEKGKYEPSHFVSLWYNTGLKSYTQKNSLSV
ncbi:unnamed protein product [Heterobilharzia americana]|nr:unnamed protein product [Heterobilharzia americana]